MAGVSDSFAAALQFQQAGQLAEAETLFRQLVTEEPAHIDGWTRLGEVCQGLGHLDAAADAFRQVLKLEPDNLAAHNNLGVMLLSFGRYAEARTSFEEALARRPDYPDAHNNRGIALMALKELSGAERSLRQAIQLRPDYPDSWNNLGLVLFRQGRTEEALAPFHESLRLKPDFAKAYTNLGKALRALNRPLEAAGAFESALKLCPADPSLHNDLGVLVLQQRRHKEAAEHFREAVRLRPNFNEAHNNLGNTLFELDQPAEAVASYDKALCLRPDDPHVQFNRGMALVKIGKPDEALACVRQAVRLKPNYPEALNSLGNVLKEQGRIDEAIAYYRRALMLRPDPVISSNLLYALQCCPNLSPEAIWEEHRKYGEQVIVTDAASFLPRNDTGTLSRLRLGYVSQDFRSHVMGMFSAMVVPAHDHNKFEVICYSDVTKPDAVTKRIRDGADRWVDLTGLDTAAATKRIRADEIDILIDLAGHTAGNRLPVFAQRAAPVQATLFGYLGTTGLKTVDYCITDAYLDPPGLTECFHSERLIRLPEVMWCYSGGPDLEPDSPPVTRVEHITFASLNNPAKVTLGRIDLWAEVMRAVPRSRIVLMGGVGTNGVDWLLDRFALNGIEAKRLTVIGRRSRDDYFRLYKEIDLCLDTFPYTGCNTTTDALWMGVPVVTQADRWSFTRQGVAPLTLVGLSELIVDNPEAYVKTAVALAGDIAKLGILRKELRTRLQNSPLMDVSKYTRNLENAYQQMWTEVVDRSKGRIDETREKEDGQP